MKNAVIVGDHEFKIAEKELLSTRKDVKVEFMTVIRCLVERHPSYLSSISITPSHELGGGGFFR